VLASHLVEEREREREEGGEAGGNSDVNRMKKQDENATPLFTPQQALAQRLALKCASPLVETPSVPTNIVLWR
jgi:hypothetical protein